MRVAPDDEVYRVNTVWLGPRGLTFPWTARYLAYAVWLLVFLLIILIEGVTPLHVGLPPVWEISIATLLTYAAMGLIDHERPVSAVWQTFMADLSAPRRTAPRVLVTSTRDVRVDPVPAREGVRRGPSGTAVGRRVRPAGKAG